VDTDGVKQPIASQMTWQAAAAAAAAAMDDGR